jgi:hypothetical protein
MYNRALAGKEKALGPEHTSTLYSQGRQQPVGTGTSTSTLIKAVYKSKSSQRGGDDVQPCTGWL